MQFHRTVTLSTPRIGGGSSYVKVDEGIAGLVMAVWRLRRIDDIDTDFCRTYASCQGDVIETTLPELAVGSPLRRAHWGYLMFQYGYGPQVIKVVERFGHRVMEYEEGNEPNSVWACNTWGTIRWMA